jgi:hypothetical protein
MSAKVCGGQGKGHGERRTNVIFGNMLLRRSERASVRLMKEISAAKGGFDVGQINDHLPLVP